MSPPTFPIPCWCARTWSTRRLGILRAHRDANARAVDVPRSRTRPRVPRARRDLPTDRPVVLIRFALREADDPIDAASFRATVDGVDRTARFRVTAAEAWGTLADSGTTDTDSARAIAADGPHTIAARVCSARGVCGALTVVVDVRPWERALGRPPRSD